MMRSNQDIRRLVAFTLLPVFVSLLLVGCSAEENPVTPEKMKEIRRKEADERANFNPNMNAPKPGN